MSTLYQPSYTMKLPPGAEVRERDGVREARICRRGRRPIWAPLTESGDRVRLYSDTWHGRWEDEHGLERQEALAKDKAAAQQMLAAKVREAERRKAGLSDARAELLNLPLADHLPEWRRDLVSRSVTPADAARYGMHVARCLEACGFALPRDIDPVAVREYLQDMRADGGAAALDRDAYRPAEAAALLGVTLKAAGREVTKLGLPALGWGKSRRFPRETVAALLERRARGVSPRTRNHHAQSLRRFGRWLAKRCGLGQGWLDDLEHECEEGDQRRDRRSLTPGELARLLAAARASGRELRGLTGPDRALLYALAAATGYRAGELAELTPQSFDLAGPVPTAFLGAAHTKNARHAQQPLPADVVELLGAWLPGRPARRPLWPGAWHQRAADLVRHDLAACDPPIPYAVDGPAGPLYADFHSLRHTYVSLLEAAGLSVRQAMQLARHSDPKLTLKRYGRLTLLDLGAAVGRLPRVFGVQAACKGEGLAS